ncbi:hypothetical protein [Mesorhizobium xinjiangense]|uniref:hypothetical protein n=1 Tax=Mesorhizobium xinjiangense TaxID=2678685 RepID=UPI0012EE00DD|nr:hypothetical protein [Mesorhizobium xinjiangense]
MTAHSLIDHLIDFGERRGPARRQDRAPALAPVFGDMPFDQGGAEPAVAQPDVDALVAEAVTAAEAALTESLNAEAEEALAAERERHAAALAAVQEQFSAETSEKLLERLNEMESRLADLTTTIVARLLTPVLGGEAQTRAVERLATLIGEAVRDSDAVRIQVQGSASLCEALRQRAETWTASIEFSETGDHDLTVTVDENVYQTRLGAWSEAISEAVA